MVQSQTNEWHIKAAAAAAKRTKQKMNAIEAARPNNESAQINARHFDERNSKHHTDEMIHATDRVKLLLSSHC